VPLVVEEAQTLQNQPGEKLTKIRRVNVLAPAEPERQDSGK